MALSGQLSTDNKYIKYTIEIIQNSQNIGANTSNVTVKVRFFRTNTGYETYGNGTVYCKIDGTTYNASVTSSQKINNSGIVLFNKTLNITHGGDGVKKLTCSAWIKHSTVDSNEQSFSTNLTTIPRTSSFTLSQSSVTLGSTEQVVTINRASSSFTHKVVYKIGSHTWEAQAASGTATTVRFTPSKNDCSHITTATSATATVVVETYNGSNRIGTSSKTFVAVVPNDVVPTFSELRQTVIDAGAEARFGYVQANSKAKLDILGASGVYGSSIKSYSISGGGNTGTGSSLTTSTLTAPGNITFTAFVTDSRGRKSAERKVTINVQEYLVPKINSLKVQRTDANGNAANEGQFITITPNFSYSTLGGKNSLITYLGLRAGDEADYTALEPVPGAGESATFGGISPDSSYTVNFMIEDLITSPVSITSSIGSAFVTMDFRKGGRGVSIGKISEVDDLFEVAMNTNIIGKLTINGKPIQVSVDWNNVPTITINGDIKNVTKIFPKANGGSWINGSENGSIVPVQLSTGSYHPLLSQKSSGGHKISMGGIDNKYGFYIYDANRTANGVDKKFEFDLANKHLNTDLRINTSEWVYAGLGVYLPKGDGGWFMQDNTWVRSYNDKGIYSGGIIQSGTNIKVTGGGKLFRMGNGSTDCYLHNEKHTGYFQCKDDGKFAFSNGPLWGYQAIIGKAEWSEISIFPSGDNRGNLGTNQYTWNTLKSTNQYSINSLAPQKSANITPYSDKEHLYDIFKDINVYMLNTCSTEYTKEKIDKDGVPEVVELRKPKTQKLNDIKLTVNAAEMPMLIAPKNIDGDDGNTSVEISAMLSGLSGAFSYACGKIERQEEIIEVLNSRINQMEELLNGFIN